VAPLEPVEPLTLYPTPRYFADSAYGVRYAHPQLAYDQAPPPDLTPAAQAAWDAGGNDRYVVIAHLDGGRAIVRAYGETARAMTYAHDAAAALVDRSGRLHLGTIVDGAPFVLRGIVEGHYGDPLQRWQRRCLLDHLASMRGNLYLYGPKDDPFAHAQWADPYPPDDAAAITDAVAAAAARGLDFAWAVSPGLQQNYPAPGGSISFASDADFARLTAKLDAMRALGVTRFALFLDDIEPSLVWPADAAAFATPAAAQVALANRLDDYVTAAGAPHLLFVGPVYTSKFDGWEPWATEVGATLHAGIEVLWTGPAIYPDLMSPGDLTTPDLLLQRNVVIWNNQPTAPVALSGFSPALPTAARGFLSNTIMVQSGGTEYTFDDLWKIVGTLGDYTWNPGAYDPNRSLAAWSDYLSTATPCGGP
jgi:hyaluronoglucosaminidase